MQQLERQVRNLIPLTNPEMPELPSDFRSLGESGVVPEEALYKALYSNGTFQMPFSINKAGAKQTTRVLAGHLWGRERLKTNYGPRNARVMIVGKCASFGELQDRQLLVGEYGEILSSAFRYAGLTEAECDRFYITNVLKTPPLEFGSKFPKLWVDNQLILLWQEILLVRPEFVLLQGNDVIKAVLGSKFNLSKTEGQIIERTFNCADSPDDEPDLITVKFMTSTSPAAVLAERSRPGDAKDSKFKSHAEKRFNEQIKTFVTALRGESLERGQDFAWELIDNDRDLIDALTRMRQECTDGVVAWDAEWQGAHPQNDGAYVRCIQFAWKKNHACVIALTHPGGQPRFTWTPSGFSEPTTINGAKVAAKLCKRFMKGLRVCGHYFVADLEMLVPLGLDLREEFDAAESPEAARNGQGGVATELMAHAWEETALFSLDEQIAAHLHMPKYSDPLNKLKLEAAQELQHWVREALKPYANTMRIFRAARKRHEKAVAKHASQPTARNREAVRQAKAVLLQAEALVPRAEALRKQVETQRAAREKELNDGYGWMPDEVLYPYGAWDAYAELELGRFYTENLAADRFGNDCWTAYWISHQAALTVLEINTEGLLIDRQQVDDHSVVFARRRDELLAELRRELRWPDFNPRSQFHVAEMLFGEKYNGYLQRYGKRQRCRPAGALTLRCEPLRSTGKYPVEWSEIRQQRREKISAPSSSKQTLGEMYYAKEKLKSRVYNPTFNRWEIVQQDHSKVIGLLRDFRYIDQALKGLLRDPNSDGAGGYSESDDGLLEYDRGVTEVMCDDGRVRTRIRQTVETGRWASSSPNLQNLSSSRQADYVRIIGKDKLKSSIKTIFTAPPGHFLIQADYSGAELMVMAIMAQDDTMIDHCQRNALGDEHPDFFDIHSNLTVQTFRLDCEPTKEGLESIGKAHLRVLGKAVVFGTAYGRGPKALAVSARQEGVFVTEDEARALQQGFFDQYPGLRNLFAEAHSRVKVGWLRNMFGRYRRFAFTNDQSKYQAMCREAQNSAIQGGVADAMSLAIRNIYDYRNENQMRFKICLQIHDAIMLTVPAEELMHVIDKDSGVFKRCMVDQVPLYPTSLTGEPLPIANPYFFGFDVDIYGRWGEVATPDRFVPYGLDPGIAGWKRDQEGHWVWKNEKSFTGRKWDSSGYEILSA